MDYLVKPFSFERFIKAVNKACEKIKLIKSSGKSGPDPLAGICLRDKTILINDTINNLEKIFVYFLLEKQADLGRIMASFPH